MEGRVYLVGAGPGDPGLITARGLELLRRADVVVYDRPADPRLLRQARAEARIVNVGRSGRKRRRPQRAINRLLERHARRGRTVVRLKGGDPFIFGRGGEEAEWLASRSVPFEVVPGVTAAVASAAYAGIPLTHRDRASNVTFVTGRRRNGRALPDVPRDGTLVIYMAVRTMPDTMRDLIEHGWDPETPACAIEWASTPRQRLVQGTVGTLAERAREAKLRPPAVAVIGRVVDLRATLGWFDSRPLSGLRVVVTRSSEQAGALGSRLAELGADVRESPAIEIRPVARWRPVDAVLRDVQHYDAIVFTSQNAVPLVFARFSALGLDARSLAGVRVAAVGSATAAALERHGVRADVMGQEFTVRALARKLARELPAGARVLHPGADKRSPILEKGLRKAGLTVRNVDVYEIARPRRRPKLRAADLITFASAQTCRNFAALSPLRPPAACIGPVTAAAARALGFTVVAEASPHTVDGLVEAILRWRKT